MKLTRLAHVAMFGAALFVARAADAQTYIHQTYAEPYTNLVNIPGITGVTNLTFSSADDGAAANVPIGFTFNFLGNDFTVVNIGSNGYLTFGTADSATTLSNQVPGTSSSPNNWIAAFWDDLIQPSTGNARYGTIGTAPHRIFVIEAGPCSRYGNSGGTIMYQFWLYEGPSRRFDMRLNGTTAGSLTFTAGYEGPNGSPSHDFLGCGASCAAANLASMPGQVYSTSLANAPELTGSFGAFPRGAFPGESATVGIRVRNLGIQTATTVTSAVYLSTDNVLDGNDLLVGTSSAADVPGGVEMPLPVSITVPAVLTPADYFLILKVDSNNTWAETNENDNVVVATGRFATAYDLAATAVAGPSGGNAGQPITLSLTVAGLGVPYAGPVDVDLFVSPDQIFDAHDTALGRVSATLSGQASEVVQLHTTLPSSLAPGNVYPIAVLDPASAIVELSETNNTVVGSTSFAVGSDFSIASVTAPAQIAVGASGQVTVRIASLTAPYQGDVEYKLYASADTTLDAHDADLGTFSVPFAGQAAIDDTRTVTPPAGMAAGRYYVIGVVDPSNLIRENSEANNTAVSSGRFINAPDFAIGAVTFSPATVEARDTLTVTTTLLSSGLTYTGSVPYRVYLSYDTTLDPGDLAIQDGSVLVSGGASTAITAHITIPNSLTVHSFYVFVEADADHLLAEADEANNSTGSSSAFAVRGADLRVDAITGPGTGFIGITYPVHLELGNEGQATAHAVRYTYYLSPNDIIRRTDMPIFTSGTSTLAAGATEVHDDLVALPAFTSTRTLYLGVIAETTSPETTQGNNIGHIAQPLAIVFPIPDLSARIIRTATAAAAGEALAVTRLITNSGVAPAASFDYAYYLSSNPTISTDDLLIGRFHASLDTGEDDYAIDQLTLPSSVATGSYYLGLVVDPAGAVTEVDETNNAAVGPQIPVYSAAIQFLTEVLPDATLGATYQVGVYASGGPVGITWRISAGALPAGLTLDAATGIISGTPTAEGVFELTLRAESGTAYAERGFRMRVLAPTVPLRVASSALPSALVGREYSATLVAVGGTVPYDWAAISQVPAGLTLEPSGLLHGVPVAPANVHLTVRVRDTLGNSASKELALNVISAGQSLVISQLLLPTAVVEADYCGQDQITFEAMGGVPPYSWAIIGNPPPGLTMAPEGTLCGVPTEVGSFEFTVRVQDQTGLFDVSLFVLDVEGGRDLAIATVSLDAGQVNEAYEAQLNAVRGKSPYAWSIVPGAGDLPAGLAIDAAAGKISGTPSKDGLFAFVVQVIDAEKRTDLQTLSIAIAAVPALPTTTDNGGCKCSGTTERRDDATSALAIGVIGLALAVRRRSGSSRGPKALAVFVIGAGLLGAGAARADLLPGTPYQLTRTPITYAQLSSPTVVFTSGDDSTSSVNLPFPFRFYDADVTSVAIGTNGAISFQPGATVGLSNQAPGTSATPNAMVAGFWRDMQLNQATDHLIGYQVDGTAPNRTFTIEYRNLSQYSSSGTLVNFEIRLFEGPAARMEIDYGSVTGSASGGTMGMEDQAGARGILFAPSGCTTACSSTDLGAVQNTRIVVVEDPGVDLVASAVAAPEFGFLGARMPVAARISNLHGIAIGPFAVELRASRTPDMANATTIYTSSVTLSAFQAADLTLDAVPPASLGEGLVWLGLYVDPANNVAEVNETNNRAISTTGARLLHGKADLAPTRIAVTSTTVQAGDVVPVDVSIANLGGLPVPDGVVAIILSTNPVISPQDVQLSTFHVSLQPGETTGQHVSVTIPAGTNSGTYYLGVLADPTDAVDELDESNNGLATSSAVAVSGGQLAIVTTRLPVGYTRVTYNGLLSAVGGGTTRTWRITAGMLPGGLGLVPSTGELFGRPTRIESQTFTVEVASEGQTATKQLTLEVVGQDAPLTIVSRTVPPAIVGQEYGFELVATGGVAGSTLAWSASNLPAGITLSARGVLGGTPAQTGSSTVAVTVTGGGQTATRSIVLAVRDNANLLITPNSLPHAVYGTAYTATLEATGGLRPLTWVIQYGQLPEGLTLSTSGVISGTPTAVGAFRIVVEARDAAPPVTQARDASTFELIVDDVPGFTIATTELPDAILDEGYDQRIQVQGGTPPIMWTVDGTWPAGLLGSPDTMTNELRLVGQPTAVGISTVLVQAVDSAGRVAKRAFAVRVTEKKQEIATTTTKDDGCTCTASHASSQGGPFSLLLLAGLVALRRRRRA